LWLERRGLEAGEDEAMLGVVRATPTRSERRAGTPDPQISGLYGFRGLPVTDSQVSFA
jgi:hypothetical protein